MVGVTPKRRGRPPLDEKDPSVDIHLRVPSKEYDVTYARAQADRGRREATELKL
jgi:hypothetical protein